MTNVYRVYVDPPSGGIDLKVTMTRADADDNWPMVLFLYSLPSLPNDYCSRGANGDMSCCWPYSDGAAGEPEAVCPLRDGDTLALAAGVLILGNTKEIVHRISARGHYLISAKSYGYGGGDYIIQAVLENGATVNPSSTSDADMVPGPIKYGDTVVSQIKHSGQVDEWTFQGEKGDLIDVTMSPDFAPMTDDQGNSPVMSRCGKPYGKGLVCLDTYLMLVAPSGKLEEANHEAARGKAWGSHIGTKIRPIDPFGTETGWGGPFLSLEAGQHMLMETGTYAIKATGMSVSNDQEKRRRYGIGPVGGYYLQLASYGKHSGVLPPECPRLPPDAVKGFDGVPGCANFQWGGGANPARPRMDKRHPNCEKFFPQAPLIGGNTAVDEPQIRNWKIHKTGKYIARVRPLKNNCFLSKVYGYYWSQFVCHANAGLRHQVEGAGHAEISPGAGARLRPLAPAPVGRRRGRHGHGDRCLGAHHAPVRGRPVRFGHWGQNGDHGRDRRVLQAQGRGERLRQRQQVRGLLPRLPLQAVGAPGRLGAQRRGRQGALYGERGRRAVHRGGRLHGLRDEPPDEAARRVRLQHHPRPPGARAVLRAGGRVRQARHHGARALPRIHDGERPRAAHPRLQSPEERDVRGLGLLRVGLHAGANVRPQHV